MWYNLYAERGVKLLTIKKNAIRMFANMAYDNHGMLSLLTPAGLITGYLVADKDSEEYLLKMGKALKELLEDSDKPLQGNDGYILMKDVTVFTSSKELRFNMLTVFIDQIIAVTIADKITI